MWRAEEDQRLLSAGWPSNPRKHPAYASEYWDCKCMPAHPASISGHCESCLGSYVFIINTLLTTLPGQPSSTFLSVTKSLKKASICECEQIKQKTHLWKCSLLIGLHLVIILRRSFQMMDGQETVVKKLQNLLKSYKTRILTVISSCPSQSEWPKNRKTAEDMQPCTVEFRINQGSSV